MASKYRMHHYNLQFVYFLPYFSSCGLYWRVVSVTDNLCTNQDILSFLSVKSVVYNQERVIMARIRYSCIHCILPRNSLRIRKGMYDLQKYSVWNYRGNYRALQRNAYLHCNLSFFKTIRNIILSCRYWWLLY